VVEAVLVQLVQAEMDLYLAQAVMELQIAFQVLQ